ncbi:MAG: GNAT family N-acetyltransferase [Acidimicrobiales bacterium]
MADLETERLRLRRWTTDDVDGLAEVFAEPEVWWYPFRRGLDHGDADRFVRRELQRWRERGFGYWAVENNDTGQLLGYTGLGIPDWLPEVLPAVDVGWRLHPDHWGRGLATEAGRVVVRHGFETLGLDRLLCLHEPTNQASARVAEKLGFRVDHETAGPALGEPVVVRVLTRTEWS